ncbi:F-box domain [Lasallia pustulata]|uniref:F-box domain n=1 Tax=Lasallia pustulata TaxID=136370 RepID=A0A1W5CT66_9LECA|nr:F-box domain [Lasallia pustulata]
MEGFRRAPTAGNSSTPITSGAVLEAAKANMSNNNSVNTSCGTTPSFTRSTSPWSPDTSEPHTPSNGQASPRGRTLSILEPNQRLIPRPSTRRRAGPTSIDFDGGDIESRSPSHAFSAPTSNIHDTILEPRPLLAAVDTFSEVLHRSSTTGSSINLAGFAGHRDTFALLGLRRQPRWAPDLPFYFFRRLMRYLSPESYLAIRLSCRSWSAAMTDARPLRLPPVYCLPQELLELVYRHLDPVDFNAARHTCRAWMMASLEWRLLTAMLRRGGWWVGFQADLMAHGPASSDVNKEWLMSKRLATECSLGPGWTGNGLAPRRPSDAPQAYRADSTLLTSTGDMTGLVLTSHVDFSEFSDSCYSTADATPAPPAVHFTVSVCNRFVLVTDNCTIYIYRLRDHPPSTSNFAPTHPSHRPHLTPLTSVICPRRVLAVSMDTSSQRFAIAALLEGRTGLVCDLQMDASQRPSPASCNPLHPSTSSAAQHPTPTTHSHPSHTSSRTPDHHIASILGAPPSRSWSTGSSGEDNLQARRGTFASPVGPTSSAPPPLAQSPTSAHKAGIRVESGPRSLYRNLCSPDDPPVSVAICPQRRCVAFGCGAGIELHWVDGLTGQDLNRWFPLATAAGYLYFLPPRRGAESAKKLRLMASGAWEAGLEAGARGAVESDHFQARPLSDGYHVLFTDPGTGLLCLGSDAPLGGPTKLLRKVVFLGPQGGGVPRFAEGEVFTWEVDGGGEGAVWERAVLRDGAVVDVRDRDGDVIMRDAPESGMPTVQVGDRAVGFDGPASKFSPAAEGLEAKSADAIAFSGHGWVERVVERVPDVETEDDDSGYGSD